MKRLVSILVLAMLVSGIAVAQASAEKENVCHITGNGTYRLISVAAEAVPAHLAHGDSLPGVAVGAPYDGLYGSTVTPVLGDDCSSVLRIDSTQNFGVGGWAGWSCVEPGHPKVVGGGVVPEGSGVMAQGPAEYGAAAVGGYDYPDYPHYCYNNGGVCPGVNAPGGEEGWVVRADSPVPTGIFVLCGQ